MFWGTLMEGDEPLPQKSMPSQPPLLRVHTFIDGQNLFHAARRQLGYNQANYDPLKLSQAVTALYPNRTLVQVHFYTGVHKVEVQADLHHFWTNKLQAMRRAGVKVSYRSLKYSDQEFVNEQGKRYTFKVPREKGIDLRLGLDLVRLARKNEYDLAIIFSQDTDLREAVQEVFDLRKELNRWISLECAYPQGIEDLQYGIPGIRQIRFDKALYDACIDPDTKTYWPSEPGGP